jgi:hypothetical protein
MLFIALRHRLSALSSERLLGVFVFLPRLFARFRAVFWVWPTASSRLS